MTKNEEMFGSWADPLEEFLNSQDFKTIGRTLKQQSDEGKAIRPTFDKTFRAFQTCPWDRIKVVFLTNNPYTGDESDGLAFSGSKDAILAPKVLGKVFDSIEKDVLDGLYLDRDHDLTRWAKQGVLLLNCDLSYIKEKRGSHLELWKPFIRFVIRTLNEKSGVIFCLIGTEAEKYWDHIDINSHLIISVEHPMKAVIEKRDWDHEHLFDDINRASSFIFNTVIKWD